MSLEARYEVAVQEVDAVPQSTDSPESKAVAGVKAPASQTTEIVPPNGWEPINLGELWRHRELLFFFVWRDVKVRYKQTVLGIAWAVLQPAMMMVVFTVFFHKLAGIDTGGLPPELFYLSGLLPWYFFQQAHNNAGAT